MSRSRYPRVATATRPKPTPAIKLPPLQVGLFDEWGELVRVVTIPDPRAAYCREWASRDYGLEARPINDEYAALVGKAVRNG